MDSGGTSVAPRHHPGRGDASTRQPTPDAQVRQFGRGPGANDMGAHSDRATTDRGDPPDGFAPPTNPDRARDGRGRACELRGMGGDDEWMSWIGSSPPTSSTSWPRTPGSWKRSTSMG